MSTTDIYARKLAAEGAAYQGQLADLKRQDDTLSARYGATPAGALDFIDPKDPFSVTGAAKRLFREQQQQQKYGAFAGGYGLDGAASSQNAKLGIDQLQRQREITDEYTAARNQIARERTSATGGWGVTQAGIAADAAAAFAADNDATLGAAPVAPAIAGEKGAAAPARAAGKTKAARGFLWRLNSDGKTWTKVRKLNAFGQ